MELLQEINRATPDDRRQAELRFIYRAFIEQGYDEGKNDGYNEGEAWGRRQERRELAKKMREQGYANDAIVTLKGLSSDEIQRL